MKAVLLLLGFAALALLDLPRLLRHGKAKEVWVYSSFLALTFAFALLLALDIKVPSPIKGLQHLAEDILHIAYPVG